MERGLHIDSRVQSEVPDSLEGREKKDRGRYYLPVPPFSRWGLRGGAGEGRPSFHRAGRKDASGDDGEGDSREADERDGACGWEGGEGEGEGEGGGEEGVGGQEGRREGFPPREEQGLEGKQKQQQPREREKGLLPPQSGEAQQEI